MEDMTELQKRASNKMHEKGWSESESAFDSPAIETIIADIEGAQAPKYNKHTKPINGSYLSAQARTKPELANRLLQNLSQRTKKYLNPVRGMIMQDPDEAAAQVALGSKSLEKSKNLYNMLGILDKFYGADIVEGRYAVAAQMYAEYLKQKNGGDGDSDEEDSESKEVNDMGQGHSDFDSSISAFQEYIETAEPYFRMISKYIDRTMNPVNTARIKRTRVEDEDGDFSDLLPLDLAQFVKITQESLLTYAADPKLAAIFLDEMTMEEKYRNEMRRYIDVFVIDNSGSMGGANILRAAAFIFNRLEKVEKGDAMVAIVEFDTDTRVYNIPEKYRDNDSPPWMIDTKRKALYAMKNIVRRYVQGVNGGTNIPAGVKRGIEMAKKMEEWGGIEPNITVVTDDDNSITSMDASSIKIPVNALALKSNTPLQDFCSSTGGLYNNLEQIDMKIGNIQ